MDKFNLQFATQRLREEEDSPIQSNWPPKDNEIEGNDNIIWKKEKVFKNPDGEIIVKYVPYYKGHIIDRGGYNFGNNEQLQKFINDYILSNQLYNKLKSEPEKPLDEESVTGTGAGMTPSTVNNPVTQDWYTTNKEGANIPKDFTNASSIPNRPSKGGFIYKKIFEELSKTLKEEVSVGDFNHYRSALNDAYQELGRDGDMEGRKAVADADKSLKDAEAAEKAINNSKITPGNKATYLKAIEGIKRYLSQSNQKNESAINEELGDYFIKISLSDIPEVIEIIKDLYRDSLKQGIINLDRETDVIYIYDKDTAQDLLSIFKDDQIEVVSHNVPLEDEEDDFYDDDDDSEFDDGPVTDFGKEKLNPGSYEKEYQSTGKTDFFRRYGGLDESYSKFKNQTKTRGKSDQFHQAIREVKKKVLEINKMYEYVSRLKEELSEGGNALEYKMHTEKALHKIKEMVSELNKKIKKFK